MHVTVGHRTLNKTKNPCIIPISWPENIFKTLTNVLSKKEVYILVWLIVVFIVFTVPISAV